MSSRLGRRIATLLTILMAATLGGCFIVSPPHTLLDRASGAAARRTASCDETGTLSHDERVLFEEALGSMVGEHVTLSSVGRVTLEIVPCRSELSSRARGERVEMSIGFARFLLEAAGDNETLRQKIVTFAVGHEVAHLVDAECRVAASDAQFCAQSVQCELRADRLATTWQRFATSDALRAMIGHALARTRASLPDHTPVDGDNAPERAAQRREALHYCVMAQELTVRAAHVHLIEATRGDRGDTASQREYNRREYDFMRAAWEQAAELRDICSELRTAATAIVPHLSGEHRAMYEDHLRCTEQRETALHTAMADLERTLAQPVDHRAFMSAQSRWTDDSIAYLRAHGGIAYPFLQNGYRADAAWLTQVEGGLRIPDGSAHGLVGVLFELSGYDVHPPATSPAEPVSTVTTMHLGLSVQAGINLVPPFAFGGRIAVGWMRADLLQATPIDRVFFGGSIFADWQIDPRAHLVLATHVRSDVPDDGFYAVQLGTTLGFEWYFGTW